MRTSAIELVRQPATTVLLLQVTGLGAAYVTQVALARLLGPTAYGSYRVLFSLANFLGLASCLGFHASAQRFIPEYTAHGLPVLARSFARFAGVITITSALIIAAAFFLIATQLLPVTAYPHTALLFAALLIPLLGWWNLLVQLSRAHRWYLTAFIPSYFAKPLAALAAITVACATARSNATTALMAVTLAFLLISTIQTSLTAPAFLAPRPRTQPPSLPRHHRTWFLTSIPMAGLAMAAALPRQLPLYTLGFIGTPTQAGLFAAALQVSLLPGLAHQAILGVYLPKASFLFHQGNSADLQRLLRHSSRLTTAVSTLAALPLLLFPGPVLTLFGDAFRTDTATFALFLLIAAELLATTIGVGHAFLMAVGHHWAVVKIFALGLLAVLLALLLSFPFQPVAGAAFAILLGALINTVLVERLARKRLGLSLLPLP